MLGHPRYFRILRGANPHTRTSWGHRKRVDRARMLAQWERFRQILVDLGVRILVMPPAFDHPGTVFPANAGLRVGETVYLSRPNPARYQERGLYRRFLTDHRIPVKELPEADSQWEGEADSFPVANPSRHPTPWTYLFTYGRLERQRFALRVGWPPYRRVYGFRTDQQAQQAIQQIVHPHEVMPLELVDERYYHGDTCLCAFGPCHEFLLAYLPALSPDARARLTHRFGDRLVPLEESDASVFAANSYQVETRPVPTLLMPAEVSPRVQAQVRERGVEPRLVDVSEFTVKGGGSIKCLLLHLGPSLGSLSAL